MPNGCELSSRGSLAGLLFQEPTCQLSLASGAESPVRSSELLAGHNSLNLVLLNSDYRVEFPPTPQARVLRSSFEAFGFQIGDYH
jgi:hypothetical protein